MINPQMNYDSYFFHLLFKIKIYEASGYSFQSLVSQLFGFAVPGFQKIAPWGNQGDGGNDGWVPTSGHYYQVYGPLSSTTLNPVSAAKKAKADFHKLHTHWPEVRHFSFVLNDRFDGIPAPIPLALADIKKKYALESVQSIGANELATLFAQISSEKKCMITGNIPTELPDFIDARAIGELLTHLADRPSRDIGMLQDLPPDFDQKISFNGLTEHIAMILRFANHQAAYVDDFLRSRGAAIQQVIGEEIRQIYIQCKKVIPNSGPETADIRFVWLLQNIIPERIRQHPHTEKAYTLAAYAILSKYFETCDVYEHPSSAHTA